MKAWVAASSAALLAVSATAATAQDAQPTQPTQPTRPAEAAEAARPTEAPQGPEAARTPHYRLDPSHSFVYAEVDHFGASTLRMRFGPLQGDVEFDRQAKKGAFGLRLNTATVSTGFAAFDSRLREADLLDADKSPDAFYVASRFGFDGETLRDITGEFTLRGVSVPLTLRATRFACYTSRLFRREVCGGDFEGELKRSDFGATFGLPFIGDRVQLRLQVEGVRQ